MLALLVRVSPRFDAVRRFRRQTGAGDTDGRWRRRRRAGIARASARYAWRAGAGDVAGPSARLLSGSRPSPARSKIRREGSQLPAPHERPRHRSADLDRRGGRHRHRWRHSSADETLVPGRSRAASVQHGWPIYSGTYLQAREQVSQNPIHPGCKRHPDAPTTIGIASASEHGCRTQLHGCTATSWQRPWPTSWRG